MELLFHPTEITSRDLWSNAVRYGAKAWLHLEGSGVRGTVHPGNRNQASIYRDYLGGGFKYLFSSLLGEMIQCD